MGSVGEWLFVVLMCELFALAHHGSLAVRRRSARMKARPEAVKTRQRDLMVLQVLAALSVGVAVALRAARGLSVSGIGFACVLLFMMVFAAGIYWRYPAGAPVAITALDWTDDEVGGCIMRIARYFWAGLAVVLATWVFVMLVLA